MDEEEKEMGSWGWEERLYIQGAEGKEIGKRKREGYGTGGYREMGKKGERMEKRSNKQCEIKYVGE